MGNAQQPVVIVGAGFVGMSLALALIQQGHQVVLLEHQDVFQPPKPRADKALALSQASLLFLESILPGLAQEAVPIQQVAVSSQGALGSLKLEAKEIDQPKLGGVVSGLSLQQRLREACIQTSQASPSLLQLIAPATILELNEHGSITYTKGDEQPKTIQARLIVGADGTYSRVRQLLGMPVELWPAEQYALVAQLKLSAHRPNTAYERFLPQGALALLPGPTYSTAVWTLPRYEVEARMQKNQEVLSECFMQEFGRRAGQVQAIEARFAYPLNRCFAKKVTQNKVVLVGNAAQTLHPIAAQGLNLGLADVQALLASLEVQETLDSYEAQRQSHRESLYSHCEQLSQLSQRKVTACPQLQSLGFLAFNLCETLRNQALSLGKV